MSADTASDLKAWSLANLLTYGRIVAIVPIAALVLSDDEAARWIALALYIAAALTDFLDGWIARRYDQQSDLGRMLDPIADKLMIAVILLALVAAGTVSGHLIWAAMLILAREVFVSGLREFLSDRKVVLHVTLLAKWKTTIQMVAIGWLIIAPAVAPDIPWAMTIGGILIWLAAFITLKTGVDYLRAGLTSLAAETEQRTTS